ncbi:hypothetical protein [Pseudotabrizicola sp. 4114]|uniref:hypothetical protein n=1 Tax=Pseudotabrizicola sp. 4114 TaxID=2817731 RepID=UPI002856328B|nr:putative dinucleotide-utilizing enzyme [Pseudorhodobacter sp. 4114]
MRSAVSADHPDDRRSRHHRVLAHDDSGRMEITPDNLALPDSPKSSALTALSVVRLIGNRANPLVI